MKVRFGLAFPLALLLAACAGSPKKLYAGPERPPAELAVLEPTPANPVVYIRSVDGQSTFTASIGYLGAVSILPGRHEFEVEVSHSVSDDDAQTPAWTAPANVTTAPLKIDRESLFSARGIGVVSAQIEAGKRYTVKLGFDNSQRGHPQPVLWIAEKPATP